MFTAGTAQTVSCLLIRFKGTVKLFADSVKKSMMLFGSTSPSYLVLQSLDAANAYLAENAEHFADFAALATARFIPCEFAFAI